MIQEAAVAEEEAGILLLQVQALRTAPMPKETMAMEEVTVCLEKTEGSLGSVEAAAVVQLATMEATEALADHWPEVEEEPLDLLFSILRSREDKAEQEDTEAAEAAEEEAIAAEEEAKAEAEMAEEGAFAQGATDCQAPAEKAAEERS